MHRTQHRNRAALQAQLLGQGFTQANQLAQQGFEQQRNLASLQPSLALHGVQQLGAAVQETWLINKLY